MKKFLGLLLVGGAVMLGACGAPSPDPDRPHGQPPEEGTAEPVAHVAPEWRTDYGEALQLAAESNRPVLVNFTGSDWCPPCQMLKRQVFDAEGFQNFAAENLVLLEIDFPMRTPQPEELKSQNAVLQERFRIEGYPTLVVLDADGTERKRHVGAMRNPQEFINWVQ